MPYLAPGRLPFQSSEESREAALAMQAHAQTQADRVYAWIRSRGAYGGTMREAEVEMPIQRSSACARFFELVAAGRIQKSDLRREKCRCYVAVTE